MKEIIISVWLLCFVLFGFALVETAMLHSLKCRVQNLQDSVVVLTKMKVQQIRTGWQSYEVSSNIFISYSPDAAKWPMTNLLQPSWQATNVFEPNTTNTNQKETP